jgi:hypothetical protein
LDDPKFEDNFIDENDDDDINADIIIKIKRKHITIITRINHDFFREYVDTGSDSEGIVEGSILLLLLRPLARELPSLPFKTADALRTGIEVLLFNTTTLIFDDDPYNPGLLPSFRFSVVNND